MDIDTAYKLLRQKFQPIHKALLKYDTACNCVDTERCQCPRLPVDTEASTELDGILWDLAQDWRPSGNNAK